MEARAALLLAVMVALAVLVVPSAGSDLAPRLPTKAMAKAAVNKEIRRLGDRVVPAVDSIVSRAIRAMLTARRASRKLTEERKEDELDRVVHETYTADMLLLKTLQYDIPFTKNKLRDTATLALGLISAPIAEETFAGLEARVGDTPDEEDSLAATYIDEYASAVANGADDVDGRMAGLEEAIRTAAPNDYEKLVELLRLPLHLAASRSSEFSQPREEFYAEHVDPVREWLQQSLQRRIREKELTKRFKEQELANLLKTQRDDRARALELMNAYVQWGVEVELNMPVPDGVSPEEMDKARQYVRMRDEWVEEFGMRIQELDHKIRHMQQLAGELAASVGSEAAPDVTEGLARAVENMTAERGRLDGKIEHLMRRIHGSGESTRRAEVAYALDILENSHYEDAMALAAATKFETDLCGRVSDGLRQTLATIEEKLGKASNKFLLMRRLVNLGRRAGNAVTGALGLFVAGAGAFIGGVGEAAAPVVVAAGYSLTAVAAKGSKDLIGLMETRKVAPNEVAQALLQWLIQMLEDPELSSRYGTDVWYKDQDVCYQRVYEVFDILTMLHDNLLDKVNSIDKSKRSRMMVNERSKGLLGRIEQHRTDALVNRAKKAIFGYGTMGVNIAKAGIRAGKSAGGKLKVPSRKKEL